jgi:hypothetical protein
LLSAIPIYRTYDVATLDGFLSPANDKGAIRPSRKPECRFFGEEIGFACSTLNLPALSPNRAKVAEL